MTLVLVYSYSTNYRRTPSASRLITPVTDYRHFHKALSENQPNLSPTADFYSVLNPNPGLSVVAPSIFSN